MKGLLVSVALAVSSFGVANVAWAHEVAEAQSQDWRAVDSETEQIRDIAGLEQLAKDFPDSGTVRLRLLQPYLAAGDAEKVLEALEWLYERGYVFGEVSQQQIPKLLDGVDPGRIAERLIAEAEVIENSSVVWTVPNDVRLVESVIRDPFAGRLLATAVNSREVVVESVSGGVVHLTLLEADNLSGIVATPDGKHLWVASGNIDGSEPVPSRFAGLLSIRPGTNDSKRIAAPEGVNVSDLAVAHDGTFYASDPIGGGVYFANADAKALEPLVAPGTFRSPQGLAVSRDGQHLYVSDYRYGIAIINLETREVSRLGSDISVILDGVDGLWRYGNELIAMQNGTSPMRISAFMLSDGGMRVVGYRILEQAHPEWTEPLSGSLDGDSLLYVGNGQWDKFVAGELGQGKVLVQTQIRRLPLAHTGG